MMLNQHMLHGGDYNPDQWLDRPDILEKDIGLMKKAHVNCVSLGIFAWTALEREEGKYTLAWLEECVQNLYDNGIYTILATPSGARPAWMAQKYPEVLRVESNLHRNRMGLRHNHCYTSPVYREKVRGIAAALAGALGNHPGVILWHLSNEYRGECFCPLCQAAFREWLKEKYQTLEALNSQWWSAFWNHTYTAWSQVEAPVPSGEMSCHGLLLDWKRFVTRQTVDFCAWEKKAVRDAGSALPVTTNLMGFYEGLHYAKFGDVLDIVSWDSYPQWHDPAYPDEKTAAMTACAHDMMRCIHPQSEPFLLMESTPGAVNWNQVSKLKKPGMHMLSSLQAVAHGANSVLYFQWRKSRGSIEKFHGAVVDHYGGEDTRVFHDVEAVGKRLKTMDEICQTRPKARVAILFDQETRWALTLRGGPRNAGMHYLETIYAHHSAFWKLGIMVDVIDPARGLEDYQMVVAPMLYLMPEDRAKKLDAYVRGGGVLVGTYWGGVTNENDLCHLGKTPFGLTEAYGLWREEIDALWDGEENALRWNGREYAVTELCERVRLEGAQALAVYGRDFYAGEPVLCKNAYGKGAAYYLAAKAEDAFYDDFYRFLAHEHGIKPCLNAALPHGVTAGARHGEQEIVFVQNFQNAPAALTLQEPYTDAETGERLCAAVTLAPYQVRVLKAESRKNTE